VSAPAWSELEALFHEALAHPPSRRAAWLAERCAAHPELRSRLEAMLRAHAETSSVLNVSRMSSPPALDRGARLGAYEILGTLGIGGMGEVFRARDTRLGRDVAVKVLPAAFVSDADRLGRFEREARVLAALNHPNIAAIYGIEEYEAGVSGFSRTIRALVLELVEGETLADRLARGPLPVGDALRIARQLAEALEAAHEKGIVHRDLKPANIRITPNGTVKVLDFGLAKAIDGDGSPAASQSPTVTVDRTQLGLIAGTPAYMSPEQARGQAVDKRADIWAFGCVLYEMLTGRCVFDGATPSDAIAAVLTGDPDWTALPATVPPTVRRLLRRCLEKDPRQRLRDIADAHDDFRDGPEPAATIETAGHRRESLLKLRQRRAAAVITAACLLALAVLVLAARTWQTDTGLRAEQFVLLPPDGMVFGGGALDRTPPLAISPDGEHLAFVATDRAGRRLLWVRPLRSLAAVPLTGTDGAREPFWSPDGSFVGFFADGKLKKVGVTGAALATLTDAPLGSGGTWNRDGTIVFAPSTQSGLLKVAEVGGTPTPVTTLTAGEYGHVYPQFLPGGRHVLYLSRAVPSRKGIYVASIDSPGATFVVAAREKARYAPPNHLLFLQDGRLMAQSFDTNAHRLAGDAVAVTDSVAFIATDGRASYDVSDTGVLVYRANGLLAASQPAWVDRAGRAVATVGEPGDYQTAALSPDGSTLAVEKHDLRTSTGDLWLIDLARGSTSRLTFDGMHNTRAVWSADSKRIVFTGRPDGIRNLHVKEVGAESDEPLLAPGPDRFPTDWSLDGRYILYEEVSSTQGDLWVLQMPERQPVPFLRSEFDERSGQFSPDGRWVAYVSNETGQREVYVRTFPAAADKRQISVDGGTAPRWSRDGRELFFVGLDSSVRAVEVSTNGEFEVGVPRVLFRTDMRRSEVPGGNTADAWFAGDGQRFFIVPNPAGPIPPALPLTVVTDWTALLRN